jgi:predicted lipid-binding transport protein (Tim44 family)
LAHYVHIKRKTQVEYGPVQNGGLIEILILAAVAGLVLARLYSVLGRRTGAERPTARPAPAQGDFRDAAPPSPAPTAIEPTGPAANGLMDIQRADPGFDPAYFVTGAKAAYEMIVQAFATGDREALRPLLTPRVYAAYDKAITDREATGDTGPELVRLKSAEIADASLSDTIARVGVKFEAELAHGLHGLRDTLEKWTFERDVRSKDPTWQLARVGAA